MARKSRALLSCAVQFYVRLHISSDSDGTIVPLIAWKEEYNAAILTHADLRGRPRGRRPIVSLSAQARR
jgi:hypothetical protein